jgi:hypothetical protein
LRSHVDPKGALNRFQVRLVPVRRQLHARREPIHKVHDERVRRRGITPPDRPRGDQLRVGVERDPCPHIAVTKLARVILGHVLGFGVHVLPHLVALNSAAREPAQDAILIALARVAEINEQAEYRALRRAGHAARRANAVALYERGHDLSASGVAQSGGVPAMLDRLRIVNSSCFLASSETA